MGKFDAKWLATIQLSYIHLGNRKSVIWLWVRTHKFKLSDQSSTNTTFGLILHFYRLSLWVHKSIQRFVIIVLIAKYWAFHSLFRRSINFSPNHSFFDVFTFDRIQHCSYPSYSSCESWQCISPRPLLFLYGQLAQCDRAVSNIMWIHIWPQFVNQSDQTTHHRRRINRVFSIWSRLAIDFNSKRKAGLLC